jgi:hypothetical protein
MTKLSREASRSTVPFGIVLTVSLLLQFSGSAEDVASFGQNSVTQEATHDGKTPNVQTQNAGEHQNWAIHFDAVEVFLQLRTFQRHQLYARLSAGG